jgi:hypothetical protein
MRIRSFLWIRLYTVSFDFTGTGWVNKQCAKKEMQPFVLRVVVVVVVVTTPYLQVVAENSLFLLYRAIFSTSAIVN